MSESEDESESKVFGMKDAIPDDGDYYWRYQNVPQYKQKFGSDEGICGVCGMKTHRDLDNCLGCYVCGRFLCVRDRCSKIYNHPSERCPKCKCACGDGDPHPNRPYHPKCKCSCKGRGHEDEGAAPPSTPADEGAVPHSTPASSEKSKDSKQSSSIQTASSQSAGGMGAAGPHCLCDCQGKCDSCDCVCDCSSHEWDWYAPQLDENGKRARICAVCTDDYAKPSDLLKFLLEETGLTRQQAVKKYYASLEAKEDKQRKEALERKEREFQERENRKRKATATPESLSKDKKDCKNKVKEKSAKRHKPEPRSDSEGESESDSKSGSDEPSESEDE